MERSGECVDDDNTTGTHNKSESTPTTATATVTAPKLNFALKKKKKKKASSSTTTTTTAGNSHQILFESNDAQDESITVAAIAQQQADQREKDGIKLVIPLKDGRNINEPLLSGFQRIIQNNPSSDGIAIEDDKGKGQGDGEGGKKENANHSLDAQATDALIRAAELANDKSSQDDNSTNFSARGDLVIQSDQHAIDTKSRINTRKQMEQDQIRLDDTIKYQRDLENRAEDIDVQSGAYVSVPISEFGAAMLRGMGWKGNDDSDRHHRGDKKSKDGDDVTPRPHRLGLGATPLPPSMGNGHGGVGKRHRARKGGSMADIAHVKKQEEQEKLWKQQMEDKERNDIQLTLNVGSVVRTRLENGKLGSRRGKLVKTAGVPGLNRVLVRFEGDAEDASVKKGDVVLVDKAELEKEPFQERKPQQTRRNPPVSRERESGRRDDVRRESKSRRGDRDRHRSRSQSSSRSRDHGRDRKKQRRERRSRSCSRSYSHDRSKNHRSRRHRDAEEDHGSSRKRNRDRDSDRESRRRGERDDRRGSSGRHLKDKGAENRGRDAENQPDSQSHKAVEHWLAVNIRVRVVTKKMAKGRQFKEKGIVLDVLKRGAEATIQMTNGEILERVPERYLETALPKVGGKAMILTGPNKFEKGKLLERNTEKGSGFIQLFEDMNVVTLSLDDIAEYCGALDDALGDY